MSEDAKEADAEKNSETDAVSEVQAEISVAIHPIICFAQIAMVVAATKVLAEILPTELYFSFRALLFDADARLAPFAVLIKVGTPVLTAFVVVMVSLGLDRLLKSRRLIPRPAVVVLTVQVAGLAAAVLLSWPMIVHWDILAGASVQDRREAFFIVYGLYAVTYFYASGIGAKLVYQFVKLNPSDALMKSEKWTHDTVLTVVTATAATSVQTWLGLV